MSEFVIKSVALSDRMKQRIANGEILADQAAVQEKMRYVAMALCKLPHSGAEYEKLQQMMLDDKLDPQAVMEVDYGNGNFLQEPIIFLLIRRGLWMKGEKELLRYMLLQQPPGLFDHGGKSIAVVAMERSLQMTDKSEVPMHLYAGLAEEGKLVLEWEAPYSDTRQRYDETAKNVVFDADVVATYVNHKLAFDLLITKMLGHLSGDWNDTLKVIELGAIVDPEYMAFEPLRPFKEVWKKDWYALKGMIAAGDKRELEQLLNSNVLGHAFSLGHGAEMCHEEFWGPFWDAGKAAMMELPEWTQARLGSDMIVMLQDAMSTSTAQQWTHRVSAPSALRER